MVVGGAIALGMALSGCNASLLGTTTSSTSASSGTSATAQALKGEVAVAFPVAACTTASGGTLSSDGWKPSVLVAPIPTALVGKVEFYSDGTHTVLGPVGWTCAQSSAADPHAGLVVYPTNDPVPPTSGPPVAGSEGIFATFDSTGSSAGVALVCPFFTVPAYQQREANCAATKPAGETSSMPTPDIAAVTDPAGVVGSLEGSGGREAVTGVVVFPQVIPAVTYGDAINIATESCAIPNSPICPTVLSDFEVREFPVPGQSSTAPTVTTPRVSTPATTVPPTTTPATTSPTTPAATPPTTDPAPPTTPSPGN